MARIEDAKWCVVTWHDAHAEPDWMTVDDIGTDPYVVKTVGWLIPDSKPDHVVICQSIGSDESIDGVLAIPVGMVVGIKLLAS